jgi:hypothetical protein
MASYVQLDKQQIDQDRLSDEQPELSPQENFKLQLVSHILGNTHSEAKEMALASKPEVFDSLLEDHLENPSNIHRFREGAKIAGFFRTHKVGTDFTKLCHVACLVAIDDLPHAKKFSLEDDCPLGFLEQQIQRCHEQKLVQLEKLFSELQRPMNEFAYSRKEDAESDSDFKVWR